MQKEYLDNKEIELLLTKLPVPFDNHSSLPRITPSRRQQTLVLVRKDELCRCGGRHDTAAVVICVTFFLYAHFIHQKHMNLYYERRSLLYWCNPFARSAGSFFYDFH